MLNVRMSSQSQKEMKSLNKKNIPLAKKIVSKIEELLENPEPHNNTRLVENPLLCRVRVDFYRIIYDFNKDEEWLLVFLIERRDKAYSNDFKKYKR